MKRKWKPSMFTDLDAGYKLARTLGMNPSHIKTEDGFRFFKVPGRGKVTTVAQRADGTGPVLELAESTRNRKRRSLRTSPKQNFGAPVDNLPKRNQELANDPTEGRPNQWHITPWWKISYFKSLEEAKRFHQDQLKDVETLATFEVCIIRFGNIEYEYCMTEEGVLARTIKKVTVKQLQKELGDSPPL